MTHRSYVESRPPIGKVVAGSCPDVGNHRKAKCTTNDFLYSEKRNKDTCSFQNILSETFSKHNIKMYVLCILEPRCDRYGMNIREIELEFLLRDDYLFVVMSVKM